MQVEDDWEGWVGDTIVKFTDGSVCRQEEYHYEYHYAYRLNVKMLGDCMFVEGLSCGIRVCGLD